MHSEIDCPNKENLLYFDCCCQPSQTLIRSAKGLPCIRVLCIYLQGSLKCRDSLQVAQPVKPRISKTSPQSFGRSYGHEKPNGQALITESNKGVQCFGCGCHRCLANLLVLSYPQKHAPEILECPQCPWLLGSSTLTQVHCFLRCTIPL